MWIYSSKSGHRMTNTLNGEYYTHKMQIKKIFILEKQNQHKEYFVLCIQASSLRHT